MTTKTPRLSRAAELEQAIIEVVSTMDEADGSRLSMITSFDNARAALAEVYGDDFERDLALYNGEEWEEDEDSDDEDEDFEEED